MVENELTLEQQREEMRKSLEWDLENDFYRDVIGSNELRGNPNYFGQLGHGIGNSQYTKTMNSEGAVKIRDQLYQKGLREREELGIVDMPSRPGDYDVSRYAHQIVHQAVSELPLGNLEEILGGISPGTNLEVPEELKKYQGREEDLNDDDRRIILTYKCIILQAIKRGAAFKLIDQHRYDDINDQGKGLKEMYEKTKNTQRKELNEAPEEVQTEGE